MTSAEIWTLPVHERLEAFVSRFKELDKKRQHFHVGGCNLPVTDQVELAEIAQAIMPALIVCWERASYPTYRLYANTPIDLGPPSRGRR